MSYKNNKFKISALMGDEEFKLPDGSYFVSDIQDYCEHIIKKHQRQTDNPSVRLYVKKKEKRITSKIKTGYYIELLTPQTMHLLGSTKSTIIKDENSENVAKVALVHSDIVNNDYHQNSRLLYTFIPDKLFDQLLDISPKNF